MEVIDYVHTKIVEGPALAKARTRDERGRVFSTRWAFLKLRKHVDDFLSGKSQNQFIVFSGLRGTGKTTLLMQLYEYLNTQKQVQKSNLLYVSVDEARSFLGATLADLLTAYFDKELKTTPVTLDQKVFIFVDEAHFDKGWNTTLKALTDQSKNTFVIATGSSALLLETSTDSERRITKEHLFPLSFAEYQVLKGFYPPSGTAPAIRDLVFTGQPLALSLVNKMEAELKLKYPKALIEREIEDYFKRGGFAFTVRREPTEANQKLVDLIEKIVKDDLPAFRNFESDSLANVPRLLAYLAIKKAGETSHTKIAVALSTSPDTINAFFETLEKTQLLFSVKPAPSIGGSKNWAGSPWKYYFLSPSILYALRHTWGKPAMDSESRGLLWESAVASTLFRMTRTVQKPYRIFYDREEGGVDFLLLDDATGKIIPIEVGLNKTEKQVWSAIRRFDSDFGILIDSCEKTEIKDKVIHLPMTTFMFV